MTQEEKKALADALMALLDLIDPELSKKNLAALLQEWRQRGEPQYKDVLGHAAIVYRAIELLRGY